ncbi:MAG: TolC family protein [Burkholderiaceae bacterium]|jgi:outer membrane protein TolC|nr:TolC family protein [Burkholderiaceae bacterium]
MNRLIQKAMAVIALAWPLLASAQDFLPSPERVRAALEAYAEVRAAAAGQTQASESARALAAGPHETELSVAPLRRRVRDAGRTDYYNEWEVQLSRTLRLPGKAALDEQSGAHAVAAARFKLGDAQHEAARNLLAAWMGWLRAEAVVSAAQTRHDSLTHERASLQRRLELGDAAQRELDQIDAVLASARAERQQAQADVQAQRLVLDSNFPQVPVPEQAPALPAPAPLDGAPPDWMARIVAHNHELGVLEQTAAQYEAMARRAEADRMPDPTIGLRTFSERGGYERGLGLVLSIPLSGERREAEARSQFAAAEVARIQAEALRRDVMREANLAVTRAQLALSLWQAARDADSAHAASLARQRRAYELGEIGLAERLQAERLAADAALAELRARADAHERLLRVQVDGHALWQEQDPAAATTAPTHEDANNEGKDPEQEQHE